MNIYGIITFFVTILLLVNFSEARYRLKFPRGEYGMGLLADDHFLLRARRQMDPSQDSTIFRKKRFANLDLQDPDKAVLSLLKDDTNFLPPQRSEGIA